MNAKGVICGLTDVPLNERGLEQAERLADAAEGRGIEVILCSPMLRAQQTAAAVSRRLGLPIITEPLLMEQDYGEFEGKDRLTEGFLFCKRNLACRCPGGESALQVAHRVYSLLDDVAQRYAGKTVLLVCHGGLARVMRTYFIDMTADQFTAYVMDNCHLEEYTL
ncbi:MAG: histidine phosphatase family protein [Ruminococcaceae bacterium]|nr:histidine phosphatase family protein [Oscillospiraceae bacterium]